MKRNVILLMGVVAVGCASPPRTVPGLLDQSGPMVPYVPGTHPVTPCP